MPKGCGLLMALQHRDPSRNQLPSLQCQAPPCERVEQPGAGLQGPGTCEDPLELDITGITVITNLGGQLSSILGHC